jgi:catechol 2,3-dioxygenase
MSRRLDGGDQSGGAGLSGAGAGTSIDPRVDIGHVHLKVADIERALEFWHGVLGFDVTQQLGDQAAFLSAGGYHHHVGANTWRSGGAPPPAPGSAALRRFEIALPDAAERDALAERLAAGGLEIVADPAGPLARDPSANAFVLL